MNQSPYTSDNFFTTKKEEFSRFKFKNSSSMESQTSATKFKVLIFPWLATGHISPYLELAKILSRKQFQPYFCSTAINLTSIQNTFKNNSWDFPIEFIELHLPNFPNLPPQFHTTKDLPSHLNPILMDAFQESQPSFAQILNNLKPDLVIYDSFQSWAAKLASSMNIPCIHFFTSGAATLSFFSHYSTRWSKDGDIKSSYPFPEIYISEAEMKKVISVSSSKTHDIEDLAYSSFELSTDFVLINSCKETEGKYIEHLSSIIGKKIVPLGPLVQEVKALDSYPHILDWLDKKTQSSVVFVSFGSEYFLSKEEMEEIAGGLELSNANFLWAVRTSEGNTLKDALPEGFLERVENRGLVVEGWAPQARILQHPSIGGFVSHCGWNSVMESLYYGVAVIAIPVQFDQPTNARMMEGIGVGVVVARDECGKLNGENIASLVKKVVVEKDGELLREKARELKEKLKIEKEVNINGALEQLWKVCQEGKQK